MTIRLLPDLLGLTQKMQRKILVPRDKPVRVPPGRIQASLPSVFSRGYQPLPIQKSLFVSK